MNKTRITALFTAIAWITAAPAIAAGQGSYPNKPVSLVVPFGAGSSTDQLARTLARQMSLDLGQPIVVENRSGAGGMVGSAPVARAAPDGYTLVMGTIASHSVAPSTMAKPPYDVLRDFTPISLVAIFPNVIAIGKNVPATNFKELLAWSEKHGAIDYATGGIGSSGQMGGELLKLRTGIKLNHVPYKDIGQGINDVLGSNVSMIIYQVPALLQHIRSGAMKPIMVLSPQRSPELPDVPTPRELGFENFDASAWMGLFGPAHMPDALRDQLQQAAARALQEPKTRKLLIDNGFTLVGGTAEQFTAFLKEDIPKWADVIQRSGGKAK